MLAASPLLRTAVGYSHTLECVVDFYQDGAPAWLAAPVIDGTLTADRGSKDRLSCNITLAIEEWADLPVDNKGGRFKVRRGLGTLGYRESLQLGEFRIDKITRPAVGAVQITGSGLEAYITDARFLRPRTPLYGASTIDQIRSLVHEVLPGEAFELRNTQDRRVLATATWDRERFDAITALADSIDAEVYVNANGHWVIADKPNPLVGSPVFLIDEGEGGVLVSRAEVDTRDRVYNAASVAGQSSDQNVPPVWAWAADLDPSSPTYYYGPFGQKPIFFSSQFFTTTGQCQAYADKLLVQSLAANVSLSFASVPVDFLEVGDVIGLRTRTGQMEALILESYRFQLGVGGDMSCETLSTKVLIADGV